MNRLKMAMIETILSLHRQGWSNRRIAKELGIDRDTVSRQIRQFQATAKTAKVIIGSEQESNNEKTAKVIIGSQESPSANAAAPAELDEAVKSHSRCEPWRTVIVRKVVTGRFKTGSPALSMIRVPISSLSEVTAIVFCRSSSQEKPLAEQIELGSAKHLPL